VLHLAFMEEVQKYYEGITITDLGESEREIRGEIPLAIVQSLKSRAIRNLGETISIDGFRRGHVPEAVLRQKIGDGHILEEIADMAIKKAYPEIITEFAIPAIGRPAITITKLAWDNPIGFAAKTAVLPNIELHNYKKIANDALSKITPENTTISNEELEQALKTIRTNIAREELQRKQDQSKESASNHLEIKDDDLPELTDEFVKKLGNFENVDDFKDKVRTNIGLEKERKEKEKRRIAIIDALIENTAITLPNILVESELDRMSAEFANQIERIGMKTDDYFKHIGKTPEDARKEWKGDAQKRAKLELILGEIAKREDITPPKDKVDRQVAHLLEHHKDADRNAVRMHVENMMTNELVLEFLETGKQSNTNSDTEK
jgi:FKBP-type peptidyl-prolyl cis-trans isomerase (trigger factor)